MRINFKSKICMFIIILIITLVLTHQAEELMEKQKEVNLANDIEDKVIEEINLSKYTYFKEDKNTQLLDFVKDLTGLDRIDCEYLIGECNEKGIDVFVALGLIRLESNFDPLTVGSKGERGLGQLMENTAKPVAINLGYEYNPDKLFEPQYNIELFLTQFKYLYEFYDYDLHKTLTAYNRGQYGLEKYIASRSSTYRNSSMSDYSVRVTDYAFKFKEEFVNIQ